MGNALEALTGGVEAGNPNPAFHVPGAANYEFFEFGVYNESTGLGPHVRCRIGDGQGDKWIETKGGFGHWEIVTRPYLPALTVWRGPVEAYSHKIPFILDGWTDQNESAVEEGCTNIEILAGVLGQVGSDHTLTEPPTVYLNGYGAIPNDLQHRPDLEWVITDIEWGEPVRTPLTGQRVRQGGAITFTVHESNTALERSGQTRKAKHPYIVKKKESFEKVAKKVFHHSGLGTKLARLNGRQNARETVVGEISLPDEAERKRWFAEKHISKNTAHHH